MLHRILPVMDPRLYTAPIDEPGATVHLRYLGTAGFVITAGQHTVVLDPYVSRPGVLDSLRPLVPKADLIRKILPLADDVVIGHSHHDHILDGPQLCIHSGARFIGSPSACTVARAAGVPPDHIVETLGGEDIPSGPGHLRGLPSRHGKIYGRVALPGTIDSMPHWPARLWQFKHGLVLNWLVDLGGVRVVHIDSADFIERELASVGRADVACLCAIGRQYRPGFVRQAIELLQPRYVVACHWDLFTTPYDLPPPSAPWSRPSWLHRRGARSGLHSRDHALRGKHPGGTIKLTAPLRSHKVARHRLECLCARLPGSLRRTPHSMVG